MKVFAKKCVSVPFQSRYFMLKLIPASTIILSTLLPGTAIHQLHAQTGPPIFRWGGSVEVSTSTLTMREGETVSYSVRLSEQPLADGWWVFVQVDGVVYHDGEFTKPGETEPWIRWVPSVGWETDPVPGSSDPTRWRTVSITARQDDDDDDEFLTFTHEVWDKDTNCPEFLHAVAPVQVRIIDDDRPGGTAPDLEIQDAEVTEGGIAEFTVTLSSAATGAVTVSYATVDGTATAGADYTTTSGMLSFTPGQTTKRVEVQTLPDTDQEGAESFTVRLSGATGATLTDGVATGTILDDDDRPSLRIGDARVTEGGTAEFTVTLSSAATGAVTVSYATVDGTATAGADYTTTSGMLTFEVDRQDTTRRGPDAPGRRSRGDRDLHGPAERALRRDGGRRYRRPGRSPTTTSADDHDRRRKGDRRRDRRVHGDAELRCDGSSDGVLCHGRRDGDRRCRLHDHERDADVRGEWRQDTTRRGPDARGRRSRGDRDLHGPAERALRRHGGRRYRDRHDHRQRRSADDHDRRRKGDRRRDRRVHGDAELRCDGSSDGVLCHGRRDGDRRCRLHDHERDADVRGEWRQDTTRRGPDARGRRSRGDRDLHGPAERALRRHGGRRYRDRHDHRQRRSADDHDRRRKGDRRRDRRVHGDAELRCDGSSDGVLCHGRRDGDRRCRLHDHERDADVRGEWRQDTTRRGPDARGRRSRGDRDLHGPAERALRRHGGRRYRDRHDHRREQ